MRSLTSVEQAIADILVRAAMQGKTVTFTEIMNEVHIGRRYLGEYLSHIGEKCKGLGLPIITSIVVYKGSNKVGKGYSEFEPNFVNDPQLAKDEQNKVFAQDSWKKLSKCEATWTNDIQLNDAAKAIEGEALDRHVWVHKRDINLRDQCLEEKGKKCSICGFDPVAKYGVGFENIIEVHHKNPVSTGVRETTLNDLIPVCPNCHRVLHSKVDGVYDPEDIKKIVDAHNE